MFVINHQNPIRCLIVMVFVIGILGCTLPLHAQNQVVEPDSAIAMPSYSYGAKAMTVDQHIFIVANHTWPGVRTMKFDQNGQPGTWHTTTHLPDKAGYQFNAAIVHQKRIYVLGGSYKDSQSNQYVESDQVVFSKIDDKGTLGDWQFTATLPQPVRMGSAVVAGEYMYYVGGRNQRHVFMTKITEDGKLSPWLQTTPLPSNRYNAAVFSYGSYVYVVGGLVMHQRPVETSYRAKVNDDGTLGKWQRTEPLPLALASAATVQINDRIYLCGGNQGNPQILGSCIESDGHLAPWTAWQLNVLDGLTMHAATTYNDDILLVGGLKKNEQGKVQAIDKIWRINLGSE